MNTHQLETESVVTAREKPTLTGVTDKRKVPACPPGPYEVLAGDPASVKLDAQSGVRIEGTIMGDDDFDFAVYTERNFVRFLNGDNPRPQYEKEAERAYTFRWTPRGKGPWVLVLSAYGRKYGREIRVDLRSE